MQSTVLSFFHQIFQLSVAINDCSVLLIIQCFDKLMILIFLCNMFEQRWKESVTWYFLIKIDKIWPLGFYESFHSFIFKQNVVLLLLIKTLSIFYQILLCEHDRVVNCIALNCDLIHTYFYHFVTLFRNRNQTLL